jgi:hypothetical protein
MSTHEQPGAGQLSRDLQERGAALRGTSHEDDTGQRRWRRRVCRVAACVGVLALGSGTAVAVTSGNDVPVSRLDTSLLPPCLKHALQEHMTLIAAEQTCGRPLGADRTPPTPPPPLSSASRKRS